MMMMIISHTGQYSCLRVDLKFKREFSYYMIQIYIPCCMLVIVSWVSFWLDPNAIPARVSLGVTTLLTMATQISAINASLPPVSYTKAIDVWTGCCLTFVFAALLEFALVNYASQREALQKTRQKAIQKHQAYLAAQRRIDLETGVLGVPGVSGGDGVMEVLSVAEGAPLSFSKIEVNTLELFLYLILLSSKGYFLILLMLL